MRRLHLSYLVYTLVPSMCTSWYLLLEYTRAATPASFKAKPLCMLVKYLRLYTEVKNNNFPLPYQAPRHEGAKLWSVIFHVIRVKAEWFLTRSFPKPQKLNRKLLKRYMLLIYSTEVLLFLSIIPDLADTRVEKFRSPRSCFCIRKYSWTAISTFSL
jgi:hypothetical protein